MSGGRNSRMGDGRSGMIIQAELKRKQSEYEGEACTVDKVIELPAQRFQQFSRALLADYDFIAENKNAIRHDTDSRHCLLILDADGTDGFLVDPQGYNYARYSAFVPNVRSLLTPDVEIDRSYLSPAEPRRDENRDEMLRMTLHVDGKPDYILVLPADEAYLNAVKAYLDIDVFADAMLCDIRFKVPYIGELICDTDCPAIRDQQNALITSLNLKLSGVSKKRTRLYEDFTEGVLDEEEYAFAKKAYDEQYADLSRRLDEVVQRKVKFAEAMSEDNKWLTLMKSVSGAEKPSQELVDESVELVKVHEDGSIELVMKYGDIYALTVQSIKEVQEAM